MHEWRLVDFDPVGYFSPEDESTLILIPASFLESSSSPILEEDDGASLSCIEVTSVGLLELMYKIRFKRSAAAMADACLFNLDCGGDATSFGCLPPLTGLCKNRPFNLCSGYLRSGVRGGPVCLDSITGSEL